MSEYTQVGPEKGWFCMLIIFDLHCIVLVSPTEEGLTTHTHLRRG